MAKNWESRTMTRIVVVLVAVAFVLGTAALTLAEEGPAAPKPAAPRGPGVGRPGEEGPRGAGFEHLPPQLRERLMRLSPEERRAAMERIRNLSPEERRKLLAPRGGEGAPRDEARRPARPDRAPRPEGKAEKPGRPGEKSVAKKAGRKAKTDRKALARKHRKARRGGGGDWRALRAWNRSGPRMADRRAGRAGHRGRMAFHGQRGPGGAGRSMPWMGRQGPGRRGPGMPWMGRRGPGGQGRGMAWMGRMGRGGPERGEPWMGQRGPGGRGHGMPWMGQRGRGGPDRRMTFRGQDGPDRRGLATLLGRMEPETRRHLLLRLRNARPEDRAKFLERFAPRAEREPREGSGAPWMRSGHPGQGRGPMFGGRGDQRLFR
jgi:hypothetical protein